MAEPFLFLCASLRTMNTFQNKLDVRALLASDGWLEEAVGSLKQQGSCLVMAIAR